MPTITYTEAERVALAKLLAPLVADLLKPTTPAPGPTTPDPDTQPEPTTPGPTPTPPKGTVKSLTLDPAPGLPGWNGTSQKGGKLTVVDAPGRPGRKAMKAEVTGERAEAMVTPSGHIPHGATYVCGWSTMLGEGWHDTSSWQIIWQLHGVGDKLSPAVSIRADQGQWVLWLRGGANDEPKVKRPFAPYVVGQWSDFVLCGFASDTDSGNVILWHRPQGGQWSEAVTVTGPTAASHKAGQYLRMGLYGAQSATPLVLYHTGIRFGSTMAEVAQAFDDRKGPA